MLFFELRLSPFLFCFYFVLLVVVSQSVPNVHSTLPPVIVHPKSIPGGSKVSLSITQGPRTSIPSFSLLTHPPVPINVFPTQPLNNPLSGRLFVQTGMVFYFFGFILYHSIGLNRSQFRKLVWFFVSSVFFCIIALVFV